MKDCFTTMNTQRISRAHSWLRAATSVIWRRWLPRFSSSLLTSPKSSTNCQCPPSDPFPQQQDCITTWVRCLCGLWQCGRGSVNQYLPTRGSSPCCFMCSSILEGKEVREWLLIIRQDFRELAKFLVNTMTAESNWNEPALKVAVCQGLNNNIVIELECQDDEASLDSLIYLVIHLDNLLID